MPIFDQGYQHWDGAISGHAWRWLAIARRGVRTQRKYRSTRFVLLFAWLPALALGFFLAMWGLIEQKPDDFRNIFPFLPSWVLDSAKELRGPVWTLAFATFLHYETIAALILVVIVGPNLISQDLRFNAMPLYLSRPLNRFDYFAGKLGTIGAFLAAVMIIPSVMTYIVGLLFSLNFGVIKATYRVLLASLAYGALIVLVFGLLMLAISSLSKNSRYVAAIWIAIWLVGSFSADILTNSLRLAWGPTISLTNDVERVGEVMIGTDDAWGALNEAFNKARGDFGGMAAGPSSASPNPFSHDFHWRWAAWVLVGVMGVSLCILTTRVRSLDRLR